MPDGNAIRRVQLLTNKPKVTSKRPKTSPKQHSDLHELRKKQILQQHPEIRQLYGVDRRTQFYAYVIILLQLGLAYCCRSSYVKAIILGLTLGPYVNAGALCFMHEATHMLVFQRAAYNRILAIATNVAMIVPICEVMRQHHHKHHVHLGDDRYDVDVPTEWEIQVVGNSPLRKAIWLMFNMIILPARSLKRLPVRVDRFLILNWVACIGFGVCSFFYSRPMFAFLVLSLLNSQGLHPANARQIQRHVYNGDDNMVSAERPSTFSYYSWWNWFTLNVGYHVEHHDFNRIPWTRLPELRRLAGKEWYPDEVAWKGRGIREVINFVTNRKISLSDFAS